MSRSRWETSLRVPYLPLFFSFPRQTGLHLFYSPARLSLTPRVSLPLSTSPQGWRRLASFVSSLVHCLQMEQEATPPNPKEKTHIKNQNWTKQESEFLMNFLAEEARSGRKPEKGFKSCQYNAAARALNKKFSKSFSETHIVNHMKTIKRKWKNIQTVKKLSGSSFDDETCTVILGEEEFKTYIQTNQSHEPYINKPIPYYRDIEMICNNEMAAGARVAACNGTNSFSPVSLSSSPEEQINSFNVIEEEADEEVHEVTPGVQPTASNRRVINSASNGSRKRKKREDGDDSVNKQVARMVDTLEKKYVGIKMLSTQKILWNNLNRFKGNSQIPS